MRKAAGLTAIALIGIVLAACGGTPGGGNDDNSNASEKIATGDKAIKAVGKYTLTVSDAESDQVRTKIVAAINQAFEEKYPNITIERKTQSYADMLRTVQLRLQSDNAPCVAQADQGYNVDGQLVKAGLLRPLDDYAEAYDWPVFDTSRWSEDGKQWGVGANYGVSPFFQLIGLYYNKKLMQQVGISPPETFDEFASALEASKQAGVTPIGLGNLEGFLATYPYQYLQSLMMDPDAVSDFVFHRSDDGFDQPGNVEAAQTLQDWASRGYFTRGFDAIGIADSDVKFASGESLFYFTGPWTIGVIGKKADDFGFVLPPRETAGAPAVTVGGLAGPWHITSRCDEPDVAAAYLDFLIGPEAQQIVAEAGDLPSRPVDPPATASELVKQLYAGRDAALEDDGVIPFEGVAAPGFEDAFGRALQELMADRITPEQFASNLQEAYGKHFSTGE